jgi:hypothetical protein
MKKVLYILLFGPILFFLSCEEDNADIIEIGDVYQGGIVFYIDSTGQHGLVSAQNDIGKYPWGCFETDIIGAVDTYIGAGSNNTLNIVENCIHTSITAAQACIYFESNGFDDWYLPSRDELLLMYNNIGLSSQDTLINNFNTGWHWSSSQVNSGYAFVVSFNAPTGGFIAEFNKYTSYRVRPTRSF